MLEHLTRKRAEFDLASLELDAGIRAWLIEDQEACLVMVAAEDVPAAQVFLFGQQTGWLHSRVGRPRSRDRD